MNVKLRFFIYWFYKPTKTNGNRRKPNEVHQMNDEISEFLDKIRVAQKFMGGEGALPGAVWD